LLAVESFFLASDVAAIWPLTQRAFFDGLLVIGSFFCCLGRGGDLAAYAAGVSTACW